MATAIAGRGRHRQPPHDPQSIPLRMQRRRRRRRSLEVRGEVYLPISGFRRAERAARAARARSSRRTRATPRPARCGRRTRASPPTRPLAVWVYGIGAREGLELATPLGDARVAARARLPHEPLRRAARVDRGGRAALRRVGAAPHRARLRDRRHRDQGRLARPAGGRSARCTSARAGRARSSGRR